MAIKQVATLRRQPHDDNGYSQPFSRIFKLTVPDETAAWHTCCSRCPGRRLLLGAAFALAGIGIGCAETAEHSAVAAFAPVEIRGSAFGLLATVQATGNGAASAVAGLLYTVALSAVAFGYLVV